MDNKDILLLKTLYEEKNITHTAKRLFLSQPALTDRLKRLEAEFGCTLFLRQPRGIQFTSEGELLYRFFLQMESSYQKIRDSLSDARIHPAGTLSIACSNVFAKYHMPRITPTVLTTLEGKPLLRETWMFYRKNYRHLASVRAFVEFMEEKY